MTGEMKGKKASRKRAYNKMVDCGPPVPSGPRGGFGGDGECGDCGHSKCGKTCNVRYVGPISLIRDHHIWHAARGVSHIWTATIVTGVALVLTGVMAYTIVDAQTTRDSQIEQNAAQTQMRQLIQRINQMDQTLRQVQANCQNP